MWVLVEILLALSMVYFLEQFIFPWIGTKLAWFGTKLAGTIAALEIAHELNLTINVGMYISVILFCAGMALYGLELFELYDFKKIKFFHFPKIPFGKFGFFPAIMLSSSLIFLLLMFLKKSLLFSLPGKAPASSQFVNQLFGLYV